MRDGTENDLSDAFRNVFNQVNELRNLLKTENEDESEVKTNLKKETAKKEKMIIIEGEIIS